MNIKVKSIKKSRKDQKRIIPLSICIILAFITLTGFGDTSGIGNVVLDPTTVIAPGVIYQQQLAVNTDRGVERAYEIEADLTEGNVVPYVFKESMTSSYKLTQMISNLTAEGYKVIAGVNGDFYSTNDYTTLGINVHNGYIYSSGSNETNALAFKSDGTAFAAKYSFEIPMIVDHTAYIQKETGEIDELGNPLYVTETEKQELNIGISHINETMGTGDTIHLFNSRYASSTKTKKSCVEVVINTDGTADPSFNNAITGTVSLVNPDTKSTPIGANQVVLSIASAAADAYQLSQLTVGDTVSISVVNTEDSYAWEEVTEAIGVHDVIAKDGQLLSSSTAAAPRTCVGIKPDGNMIIYVVDGRQPSFSNGLSITEMGEYLLSRGCTDVLNLDGGGSTTIAVRMPGDAGALVVNKPSDGSLRSVSNGLFLVAKVSSSSGTAENITLYPRQQYVLAGGTVQMSIKASDEMFQPAALPSGTLTYSTDDDDYQISASGLFSAAKAGRNITVTAAVGDMESTSLIHVIENASFLLNAKSLSVDPKSTTDVNVKSVSYMYNSILFDDSCFTWSCDPNIGTIDSNGVFTAADCKVESGNIYATFGNETQTVQVTVGKYASFSDISSNWAKEYILALANEEIISGMGDGTFAPSASVTRAQFVKLLAGAVGETDFSSVVSAGFTDINESKWYAPYVNWASQCGIVSGMGDGTYAPDATITREQMAIMINNLATAAEVILEPINDYVSFYDEELISEWSSDQVKNIVMTGIMNGKPLEVNDGTGLQTVIVFDPQGNATRAESAKVIYMTKNLLTESE